MATLKSSPIALELRQLGHEFIEGQEVFKQINIKISAGSHVVINGQNGSGKSTLGKILAGQLTSTQGSIVWKENEQVIPQESVLLASSYSGPSATLHPQMSIEEILHFHGMFRPWREGANPHKCLQDAGLSTHMGTKDNFLNSLRLQPSSSAPMIDLRTFSRRSQRLNSEQTPSANTFCKHLKNKALRFFLKPKRNLDWLHGVIEFEILQFE